jgi:hypothetical protein
MTDDSLSQAEMPEILLGLKRFPKTQLNPFDHALLRTLNKDKIDEFTSDYVDWFDYTWLLDERVDSYDIELVRRYKKEGIKHALNAYQSGLVRQETGE